MCACLCAFVCVSVCCLDETVGRLGRMFMLQGKYDRGIVEFDRQLSLAREIDDKPEAADVSSTRMLCYDNVQFLLFPSLTLQRKPGILRHRLRVHEEILLRLCHRVPGERSRREVLLLRWFRCYFWLIVSTFVAALQNN